MGESYKYWLANLNEIGTREKIQLKEIFGSEEEIYRAVEYPKRMPDMISQDTKERLQKGKREKAWENAYEEFRKKGVRLVCYQDPDYPKQLAEIHDPPYCLYVKGKLPPQSQKIVGVVGARNCSAYGRTVAENIGKELALHGVGVVSGLAYGIDAAAHHGALSGGGDTYAILGCGVDVCYPTANRELYQRIDGSGGIVSEYFMGCPPKKELFPHRNRIISALAEALIVVEAKRRSGSLITADRALEQGKAVYAVPGRISDSLSYGTNWLLSQGAAPFFSMEEFLKDMGISGEEMGLHKKLIEFPLEKNERLVYSVLDLTPQHLESVIEKTGLTFADVLRGLAGLQKRGYVKEIYKNHYIRTNWTFDANEEKS